MDDHHNDEPATDSLEAALAHARAQAGTTAATQATVPATEAVDLPDGVDPSTVTWDEVLGAGGYASARVRRGDAIRFTDLDGNVHEEDAEGIFATCIQHEIDHLNGVLFVDYLSKLKRDRVLKKFTKAAKLAGK